MKKFIAILIGSLIILTSCKTSTNDITTPMQIPSSTSPSSLTQNLSTMPVTINPEVKMYSGFPTVPDFGMCSNTQFISTHIIEDDKYTLFVYPMVFDEEIISNYSILLTDSCGFQIVEFFDNGSCKYKKDNTIVYIGMELDKNIYWIFNLESNKDYYFIAIGNDESSSIPFLITTTDFRNTQWGMTMDEVIASENVSLLAKYDDNIIYEDKILGFPVWVLYGFEDSKLFTGIYSFQQKHSNKTAFVSDFKSIRDNYTKKYGNPLSDDELWANDLYKGDTQYYGTAVAIGHLTFRTTWITETTQITLLLTGDNYSINLFVTYIPFGFEKESDTSGI